MVLPSKKGEGGYSVDLVNTPVSAQWLVRWLDLQRCLAKAGGLVITLIETEQQVATARREQRTDIEISGVDYDPIRELAAVEQLLGELVVIPDQELTPEDLQTISKLRRLLRDPIVTGTWSQIEAGFLAKESQERLAQFLNGETGALHYVEQEVLSLGGHQIPLGRVEYVLESAALADQAECARQIEELDEDTEYLFVRFVPGENNSILLRYLDWLDSPTAAPYRSLTKTTE